MNIGQRWGRQRLARMIAFPVYGCLIAYAGAMVLLLSGCGTIKPPLTEQKAAVPDAATIAPVWDDISGTTDLNHRVPRIYDVRDLLAQVPDFDNPPDLSLPAPTTQPTTMAAASGGAGNPALKRQQAVEALIKLIRGTIAPESWADSNQIRELQGQLIIRQTPANHRAIVALLDALHETRGMEITVESRFLEYNPDTLKPDGPLSAFLKNHSVDGAPSANIDDAQVNTILRDAQSNGDLVLLTGPRITLFNGQRAYVMVAKQNAYVANYRYLVSADGKVTYQPQVEAANSGIVEDIQATVTADRKSVTLHLRPQISNLERVDSMPFEKDKTLKIDRPVLAYGKLDTVVTVADGQTVALTGLSAAALAGTLPPMAATHGATAPTSQSPDTPLRNRKVLLLIKPKIIFTCDPTTQQSFPPLKTTLNP